MKEFAASKFDPLDKTHFRREQNDLNNFASHERKL